MAREGRRRLYHVPIVKKSVIKLKRANVQRKRDAQVEASVALSRFGKRKPEQANRDRKRKAARDKREHQRHWLWHPGSRRGFQGPYVPDVPQKTIGCPLQIACPSVSMFGTAVEGHCLCLYG